MISKPLLSIGIFLAASGAALGQSTQGLQDPELVVQQPGQSEERIQLEPGSIVRYLSDGNLEVQASEDFSCGGSGDCQAELSTYSAQSGGTTVEFDDGETLTVEQGDTVRFDWSARGGWECFANGLPGSGNWENDAPKAYRTFDSAQQNDNLVNTTDVPVSTSAYPASITCLPSSGQGGDTESIAIVVEEPDGTDPGPNDCSNRPSLQDLTNLTRATNVLLDSQNDSEDATSFESVFNLPFPAHTAPQRKFRLFPETYASMRFEVPNDVTTSGNFGFNELVGTSLGRKLLAISPCEGDFNPDGLPGQCVISSAGVFNPLRWTVDAGLASNRCLIEPGETYFLNIIYSDNEVGDWPVDWACPSPDRCGNTVTSNPE